MSPLPQPWPTVWTGRRRWSAPDTYTVLVFDLGGGTFDVSLLEIDSSGYLAVLATSGNTILGGEDFTQRIVQLLTMEIERKFPMASLDLKALRRLTKAIEKAKIELSSQNGTEAVIDLEVFCPEVKISSPRSLGPSLKTSVRISSTQPLRRLTTS